MDPIRQIAKLKSSPKFQRIRYNEDHSMIQVILLHERNLIVDD